MLLFTKFRFLFAFSTTITVINNNSNIDDQGTQAPSIQIFVNQLKCITREKFKIFVLKVTTSGLYLTFL